MNFAFDEIAVECLDDELRVDRLGRIDLQHDRDQEIRHVLTVRFGQLPVDLPGCIPGVRPVLVAVGTHVVERDEPAIHRKDATDLPEDTIDCCDVVRRGVVHHQIELLAWEYAVVDVHLEVGQRHCGRRCRRPCLGQEILRVVDPDGLLDQTVLDQDPLDPAVATIENQGPPEHPTAGHSREVLEPLAIGIAGDPLVDACLHHIEVVPVGVGVIDVAVVVDVECLSHPALSR